MQAIGAQFESDDSELRINKLFDMDDDEEDDEEDDLIDEEEEAEDDDW